MHESLKNKETAAENNINDNINDNNSNNNADFNNNKILYLSFLN